jgi:hypothetical protein
MVDITIYNEFISDSKFNNLLLTTIQNYNKYLDSIQIKIIVFYHKQIIKVWGESQIKYLKVNLSRNNV